MDRVDGIWVKTLCFRPFIRPSPIPAIAADMQYLSELILSPKVI